MRSLRAGLAGSTLFFGWVLWGATGCGDDDPNVGGSGPGVTTGVTTGTTTSTGTGGTGAGGANQGGMIPDTPCEDPAVASAEVYPAGTNLRLTQLKAAGNRWVAAGVDGYVRFDLDGSNADTMPTALSSSRHVLGEEPNGAVGYASSGASYVGYQRLGENGPISGPRSLSMDAAAGLTVGAAGADAITVWADNTALYGRTVDATGFLAGDAFLITAGAYATTVRLLAVSGASEMALFWYGAPNQGGAQSQFLRLDADGVIGEKNVFYTTPSQHDLVQVTAVTGGYMALIFDADATPRLLRLDENANMVASSGGLAGVSLVHGVAAQGDRIAVTARRQTGEPELRVFDLDLEPQAPWVCLDTGHDAAVPVAVTADGTGYAAIYQTADGATMLSRVDALGTGAP